MRNILIILAALVGFGAFAQTNIPTRIMLADTNGVVKWPSNITRIRIGGTDYTNLLGFGLSVTNGQLSVDTTQLPEGSGGSSLITSVGTDFEVSGGALNVTNTIGTGPLVRQSEAGSGGGGTNFINAVSADFEVLTQSLSLTNTTGTGALLRASSLSPYLLSATAASTYATLESPSFTGTVSFETIQADEVQVPFANLYASANSSSNLTGTLDGGSWTNLNGTEIRSGTVAADRIDSAIARATNAALTVGTLTISNAIQRADGRYFLDPARGDAWTWFNVGWQAATVYRGTPWTFNPIASGTADAVSSTRTNGAFVGGMTTSSSSTTNSGGMWNMGVPSSMSILGGEASDLLVRFVNTNGMVFDFGWGNQWVTITSEHSSGAYLRYTGGSLIGKTGVSSTYATTGTSFTPATNTVYRLRVAWHQAATNVTFLVLNPSTYSVLWSDTLSTNLPNNVGMGHGFRSYFTGTPAAQPLIDHGYVDIHNMNR